MRVKPGESVSIGHIEKRLQLIYGTLYFEKLWYEILGPPDHLVLKIHVTERLKTQLRFSYHYDSENKGGVVANATFRNTVLNRSRLVLEADLASYPRTTIDYFKYLGRHQNLGLQLLGSYQKNEFPIYDSLGNLNYLFSSNYTTATFRFQTTLFQNGAIGLEARYNDIQIKPKIAESSIRTISKIDYTNTYFSLYYRFDNWNERYFPTRGIKAEFKVSATTKPDATVVISDTLILGPDQLGSLLETENIASVDLTLFPIIPIGDRFSILAKTRLKVSTLDADKLNLADYDFVGGFIPGWGNANEYFGGNAKEYQLANYFYGRLSLQYQMKPSLYLQGHFNYINSNLGIEDVQMSKLGDRTNRFGYGASLGLNSPLGPLIFAFAKDHFRDEWKATLAIGFYY
jgi:outer membrane protein assembly factor BamA